MAHCPLQWGVEVPISEAELHQPSPLAQQDFFQHLATSIASWASLSRRVSSSALARVALSSTVMTVKSPSRCATVASRAVTLSALAASSASCAANELSRLL